MAVVLGAGFNPDNELPANSRVGRAFLSRLLEGVRIYRSRPDVRLLVSVPHVEASLEDKQKFLAEMVELLELDAERVSMITEAECTAD